MHYGKHRFVTYPNFHPTASDIEFGHWMLTQRQELAHLGRLLGQQGWLTSLPSLPLISRGVSLYVVSGGSQEERMVSSDCAL